VSAMEFSIPIEDVRKLCAMLRHRETDRWEEVGRPKNDGYINGSHSGYGHALRDVEQWLGYIEKAMVAKHNDEGELIKND